MSMKSIAIVGVVVVVVGAVIAFQTQGSGPTGIEVEVEPAGRHTVVQTVEATGRIQPVTQVNISADVSAKITKLEVKEGDWVEKDQFLLELDRERYLAAVESAEANLSAAEANATLVMANVNKIKKDLNRTESLFAQDLESQAVLDSVQAQLAVENARYQSAKDQAGQARASLKQASDDLSKTTIHAPMAGTVSKLNKEMGEIALGSQFQEDVIMEISNLEGMEALVEVDENDIVSVSLADGATVEVDALPGEQHGGKVTEIANSAKVSAQGTSEQRTEFEVKIAITDPSTSLRPGMTASADVITATHEDVIAVPIQCVAVRTLEQLDAEDEGEDVEADTKWQPDEDGFVEVVFVVADGKAEARQVKTGIQSETHIEILEGLEEGAQVVIGNYRAISRDLTHGAEVVLTEGGEDDGLAR